MKIQDISPVLHNLVYFQYESGERSYPKITSYKSQYAYHVLLISKGRLDVFVGDRLEHVKAGDAVYLLPGEVYRLAPCNEDFSLYNLFFDLLFQIKYLYPIYYFHFQLIYYFHLNQLKLLE